MRHKHVTREREEVVTIDASGFIAQDGASTIFTAATWLVEAAGRRGAHGRDAIGPSLLPALVARRIVRAPVGRGSCLHSLTIPSIPSSSISSIICLPGQLVLEMGMEGIDVFGLIAGRGLLEPSIRTQPA
jgi:hypothetical protein